MIYLFINFMYYIIIMLCLILFKTYQFFCFHSISVNYSSTNYINDQSSSIQLDLLPFVKSLILITYFLFTRLEYEIVYKGIDFPF